LIFDCAITFSLSRIGSFEYASKVNLVIAGIPNGYVQRSDYTS
jgi:hypothetical protein